ncbi:hypothetical protein OG21DRAFT_650736 [Imleria badia]|nr:hypothetical protein OG21DRAFT_650736 [Imleria badia]
MLSALPASRVAVWPSSGAPARWAFAFAVIVTAISITALHLRHPPGSLGLVCARDRLVLELSRLRGHLRPSSNLALGTATDHFGVETLRPRRVTLWSSISARSGRFEFAGSFFGSIVCTCCQCIANPLRRP